jgi:hypothetical protein
MCSICVYSVFVLSCVYVAALRWADHTSKESYKLWIDQETKKRPGPTRAVEPMEKKTTETEQYTESLIPPPPQKGRRYWLANFKLYLWKIVLCGKETAMVLYNTYVPTTHQTHRDVLQLYIIIYELYKY